MGQDKDGSHLDSTILLLSHTTKLVDLFNDKLAIKSNSDPRLIGLDQFYKFMSDWRNESLESNDQFVSSKLWFDLQSMCLGFRSMVAVKQAQFPSSVIKPALVNQSFLPSTIMQWVKQQSYILEARINTELDMLWPNYNQSKK